MAFQEGQGISQKDLTPEQELLESEVQVIPQTSEGETKIKAASSAKIKVTHVLGAALAGALAIPAGDVIANANTPTISLEDLKKGAGEVQTDQIPTEETLAKSSFNGKEIKVAFNIDMKKLKKQAEKEMGIYQEATARNERSTARNEKSTARNERSTARNERSTARNERATAEAEIYRKTFNAK